MSTPNHKDDVDLESLVANIMDTQHTGHKPQRKLFFNKKTRKNKSPESLDKLELNNRSYLSEMTSGQRPVKTENNTKSIKKTAPPTLTIQFSGVNIRNSAKNWSRSHRRLLRIIAISVIILTILIGAFMIVRNIKSNKEPSYAGDNVTPSDVYIPKNLPDGFSIGSASQSLENGAVLYTVHTDKGYPISITQQLKPSDLNNGMFSGAQSFDTRLGKAYIVEAPERITGYIITNESMLLFNSTGPISNTELKTLMESFQP